MLFFLDHELHELDVSDTLHGCSEFMPSTMNVSKHELGILRIYTSPADLKKGSLSHRDR